MEAFNQNFPYRGNFLSKFPLTNRNFLYRRSFKSKFPLLWKRLLREEEYNSHKSYAVDKWKDPDMARIYSANLNRKLNEAQGRDLANVELWNVCENIIKAEA